MTSASLARALLAVMGVGIVFALHPALRQVVQFGGGLYLLHLACKFWRSGQISIQRGDEVLGRVGAFRVGFLTAALNPKIALFYGSVFATALPPSPSAAHILAAVSLVYVNSIVWHTFLAWGMSRSIVQQAYLQHAVRFNRIASVLVGGFGLRLIVTTVLELLA